MMTSKEKLPVPMQVFPAVFFFSVSTNDAISFFIARCFDYNGKNNKFHAKRLLDSQKTGTFAMTYFKLFNKSIL
jgi:hypothetical protein